MLQGKYSVGVGFLNRWSAGTPIRVSTPLHALGLDHPAGYAATDIFAGKSLGTFKPGDTFVADVNPTGRIYFELVNQTCLTMSLSI